MIAYWLIWMLSKNGMPKFKNYAGTFITQQNKNKLIVEQWNNACQKVNVNLKTINYVTFLFLRLKEEFAS